MANYITSPNMKLTIPVVSLEQGPLYASDINTSLTYVDSHDHSSGKGVPVTPQGLSITSDLSFIGNNATNLFTTSYVSQGAALNTGLYKGALYVVGNELYYNDVTGGHQVPITFQGNVNAGAGSITGLTSFPSASASYNGTNGSFVWQQGVNTSADMDFGSAIMRNDTASSFALTLQPPTLSSNYSITLPTAPASSTSIVQMTTGGVMTAGLTVDGTTLANSGTVLSVANGGITTTQISPTAGITGGQIATQTITGGVFGNVATGTLVGGQGGNLQQATVSPWDLTTNYILLGPNTFTISNTSTSFTLASVNFNSLSDGSGRLWRISIIGGSCALSASGGSASIAIAFGTATGPTFLFGSSGSSSTIPFGAATANQGVGNAPTFILSVNPGIGSQNFRVFGGGTTWSAAFTGVQFLVEVI